MDSEKRVIEFNKDQNLTDMCMPELVRMVPESVSNKDVDVGNLKFIKTEDEKMQCLRCHCIFKDIEKHQRHCPQRPDDGKEDFITNAVGGKPNNFAPCPPEPSTQHSSCSNIKEELPDSLCTGIKIKQVDTNSDNTIQTTEYEDLMQCSNCKLYFNDRYVYSDHKMYTCENDLLGQTTDMEFTANEDTFDSAGAHIKNKNSYENLFESNDIPIKTEILSESGSASVGTTSSTESPVHRYESPLKCWCINCGAIFDDFLTLSTHREGCKGQKIVTVMKERNFRRIACAVCKDTFKSELELSNHMVSVHDAHCGAHKRKFSATDANDNAEELHTTLTRGTTRYPNKSAKIYLYNSFDSIQDINMHIQSVHDKTNILNDKSANYSKKKVLNDKSANQCKNEGCELFFETKEQLKKHIQDTHTVEHPHTASAKRTTRYPNIKRDMVYHCPIAGCVNYFYSDGGINMHLKSVHGVTTISKYRSAHQYKGSNINDKSDHQCKNKGCGLSFETKEQLKNHVQVTHIEPSGSPRVHFSDLVQHVCSLCNRIFQYTADICKHLIDAHNMKYNMKSNFYIVEKMNLCLTCYLYIDTHKYLEHLKTCENPNFTKKVLNESSQDASQFGLNNTRNTENNTPNTENNTQNTENNTQNTESNQVYRTDTYANNINLKDIGADSTCNTGIPNDTGLTSCFKSDFLKYYFTYQASIMTSEVSFYRCKICNFKFPRKNGIMFHLIKTHAALDSLPALEFCSKWTGKSIKEIKAYTSVLAKGEDIMYCCDFKECQLLYRTKASLEKHKAEHF